MLRKLEILTNVAIIVVAILGGAALVKNQLLAPSAPAQPPAIAVGEKIALPGVDWQANRRTVVLVLQRGCHFCAESAPFYQRLMAQVPAQGVHVLAVLPSSITEGQEYLRSLDVPIAEIKQGSFLDLKVRGTPTLILVDVSGTVRKVWFGKLPPEREAEVLAALASSTT